MVDADLERVANELASGEGLGRRQVAGLVARRR